ncbi:hypothetical protein K1T35_34080 [Pseudonocardia sp. DSM 110487]|uniref:hypothetical protein n=1 Tax=Pseudonocardia sp. DSM 110487 TaxID=2865833 RepID=UPI001C6A4359|nr:hypothetical protein [Pseudonocardia sp. DSM 110487]QYN33495.1 hypothetical protein K1T35_34080 [Pseudonocardia sp. DSM 110487]
MTTPAGAVGRTRGTSPPPIVTRRRVVDSGRLEELLGHAGAIVLAEGFTSVTMDELAHRFGCGRRARRPRRRS